MSTHHVSYPRAAKKSITEESGRPGTCKSNVGWEAIDDPCTKRMRPEGPEGSPACLFQRKSFTPSSLVVQCSVPVICGGLFMFNSLDCDFVGLDDIRPFLDFRVDVRAE